MKNNISTAIALARHYGIELIDPFDSNDTRCAYYLKQAEFANSCESGDVEEITRQLCLANGCDPEAWSEGIGRVIPRGQKYMLREAYIPAARAILDHWNQ